MEHVIQEDNIPLIGYKHMVDAFQGRMSSFITPCEQPPVEMNLLERGIVNELAKLGHAMLIQSIVILVLDTINEIEVTLDHPWARPNLPKIMQFG
jgi:hypothetical protein